MAYFITIKYNIISNNLIFRSVYSDPQCQNSLMSDIPTTLLELGYC